MKISHLNALDFLVMAVVLLSILMGLMKGFTRELFSLAFFIIAVILSFLFYSDIGNFWISKLKDKDIANFAGFICVFTVVLIIGSLITYYVKKLLIVGPLKSVDRILGGLFGLLRGTLISCVIVYALVAFPLNNQWVQKSQLSPYIMKVIDIYFQLAPPGQKEKLNFKTQSEY